VAVSARYFADKSALARLRYPDVSAVLAPKILAGEVATCSIIELEILYSARSYEDLVGTRLRRAQAFVLVDITQGDFDRALDVLQELARRGLHRAVGISDLLIAAVAERERLTLLHYDANYDHVPTVTGQAIQWVVPRGSVP
jgi:predicted nucleic acid-binding protein